MNKKIRNEVLKKIKPSQKEHKELESIVLEFIDKLEKSSKNLNFDCDFFLGGSFGKNTYLKENFDVDIFCRFDLKYENKELSNNLKKILNTLQTNKVSKGLGQEISKKSLSYGEQGSPQIVSQKNSLNLKIKYKKEKGSRDYYKYILVKNKIKIIFELVPIRKILKNSDALNSTDFSPFHVNFLKENLKINKMLCDEIRLAKQFFKAHNLYGAESYIGGFSGHVIDNLIIHYKSLENLLKEAKTWKESFFLDVNNFYKNEKEAMKKIEEAKISNLVLVDPILKNRNAARAISPQKYFEFLFIVSQFLKFSKNDFIVKKISIKKEIIKAKKFAKINNLKILIYQSSFSIEKNSDDIIGSKLLKIFGKIGNYFRELDFVVFKNNFVINFDENKSLFIYFFENIEISNLKKIKGPKVFMKEAVKKFSVTHKIRLVHTEQASVSLEKNKNVYYIEEDRVMTYKKRKITKLKQISNLKLKDLKKFFERDISFLKSLKKL